MSTVSFNYNNGILCLNIFEKKDSAQAIEWTPHTLYPNTNSQAPQSTDEKISTSISPQQNIVTHSLPLKETKEDPQFKIIFPRQNNTATKNKFQLRSWRTYAPDDLQTTIITKDCNNCQITTAIKRRPTEVKCNNCGHLLYQKK